VTLFFAFLRRDLLNALSYRLSFFLQLLGVFPSVLMFFFLSRLVDEGVAGPLHPYGGSYFPFVLIGIAVQNYLNTALSSFSGSLRESQLSGTLEAVLVTPVTPVAFLLGSTAYSFVCNALRVGLYLAVGVLCFHVRVHTEQVPLALFILALTVGAFSSLGIFSAGFIVLFKRGDPINWGFAVVSWLLGGVYYPVGVLPAWLQKTALIIPTTHTLESLRRSLLMGEGVWAVKSHLAALSLWAAFGLPVSILCFRYALNLARKNGTLGHY